MPSLNLRIILETDIVLSASAATVGSQHTLRRIRGGALLGACAAQGYHGPHSFDLFHSGRVRYGDGLPEAGASVALPLPLSLHRAKSHPQAGAAWNLAVGRPAGQEQLVQEREGFVAPDGRRVLMKTGYSMRTAVDAGGRARSGFLFGMESLEEGQVFRSIVEADDLVLLQEVEERLIGRQHRLGRSRSAEFGRVHIEKAEAAVEWPVLSGRVATLRFWCLSDLALRDDVTGAPRLTPEGSDFGLPEAHLDRARSFLRFGRWTPFNGHRGRPDLERQVILAGSVIVLQGPETDLDVLRANLAGGVGACRHEGLGQVLVQPEFLETDKVALLTPETPQPVDAQVALPEDGLGGWLQRSVAIDALRNTAWQRSREWAQEMRPYRNVPAAQWGEIRRLAALARFGGGDQNRLLNSLTRHVGMEQNPQGGDSKDRRFGRGASASRWMVEKRGGKTAAQRLLELVGHADAVSAVLTTEYLGARMARLLRQEGAGRD